MLGAVGPAAGLAEADPIAVLDHSPIRVAGLVLAVTGVAAAVAAQLATGASCYRPLRLPETDEVAELANG